MPGISLISSARGDTDLTKFVDAQLNMKYRGYRSEIFFHDDRTIIGYTGYEGYPVRLYESTDFFSTVEGIVYNRSEKEVDSFISDLILQKRHSGIQIDSLERFLLTSDGEYVLTIYDKSFGHVIIVNDALGRLPVYYAEENNKLIASREVKFVAGLLDQIKIDKLAVAEHLVFGYPLAKRTLIKNVCRLDPAILLEYDVNTGNLDIKNVHTWNLEDQFHEAKSLQESADDLVRLFREAVRCRVESFQGFKNLMSQSGGMDSRSVAAPLRDVDPSVVSVTYLDYEGRAQGDVRIARELTRRLGIDWEVIELEKRNFEQMCYLIEMKDGLNYAAMGFILDFLTKIKSRFGNKVVVWSGDAPWGALWPLKPSKAIETMDELICSILNHPSSVFKTDKLADFIDQAQVKTGLKNVLLAYPENDLNKKYQHFIIFERGYKFAFEGEDRNRFYFWVTTPYYSPAFVDYAFRIPDSYKDHHKLHLEFSRRLDRNLVRLPKPSWGRLGTLLGPYSQYVIPRILEHPRFHKLAEKMIGADSNPIYDPNDKIKNYREIRNLSCFNNCEYLSSLAKLLDRNLNEREFFTLITILLYVTHARALL